MTLKEFIIVKNSYLDFYPEDRIDIQYHNDILKQDMQDYEAGKEIDKEDLRYIRNLSSEDLSIIVYYPSITITNEYGKTHTITDVYVKISFPYIEIQLARTSYTQEEVNVGYIHSHNHKGVFKCFSRFCIGDSTYPVGVAEAKVMDFHNADYNDYYKDLTDEECEKYKLLVESLIVETERILDVESIGGVPYIEMSTIKQGAKSPVPIFVDKNMYDESLINTYSEKCTERIKKFFLYYCSLGLDKFYYDGRCWQLDCSDAEFITRVTAAAKSCKYVKKKTELFTFKSYQKGLYYEPKTNNYNLKDGVEVNWTFKGKTPTIKIFNGDKDNKVERKEILRPEILTRLYIFLLNIINGVYANNEKYKDCLHSRAYKITHTLLKSL